MERVLSYVVCIFFTIAGTAIAIGGAVYFSSPWPILVGVFFVAAGISALFAPGRIERSREQREHEQWMRAQNREETQRNLQKKLEFERQQREERFKNMR